MASASEGERPSIIEPVDGKDVLLAWKNMCLASPSADKPIFCNVSGYIVRGGVTAVMGVSSAGKTVMMQALAGRAKSLWKCGEVVLDGVKQPLQDVRGDLVYEEDQLIGDLTVRESLSSALALRREGSDASARRKQIDTVLEKLGLAHVADNVIGTVLRRGLSGGQKRRCSVGMELVQPPTVLFIDEPTSGLDATTALSLVEYIRTLARESGGKLAVMISLQQPNTRLLQMVDDIMILGQNGVLYFGTLDDAEEYFTGLGLPVPKGETPTDFYLQVTDPTSPEAQTTKFIPAYAKSQAAAKRDTIVDSALALSTEQRAKLEYHATQGQQFLTLLNRNLTVARRDVTLYYLQLALHSFYGFLVGAVFFQLDPFFIGDRINDPFNGVTWLAFICTYIHVFKTHYLVVSNARFHHEHSNRAYAVLPYWTAELISTAIGTLVFMPGVAICYFMMGLPSESFGFVFLQTYILCLAAEGSVHFVTQFFKDASYAVVAAQCLMVILCVFTTGSLIREENVPTGWEWLQELSYYFWGSKGIAKQVFSDITYECADDSFATYNTGSGTCDMNLLGFSAPCDAGEVGGRCFTKGDTVLRLYKGITGPDKWESFGKLFGLMLGFRLLVLFFYYYPVDVLVTKAKSMLFVGNERMKQLKSAAACTPEDVVLKMDGEELGDNSTGSQTAQLVWRDLSLTLGNGKVLIDHVDGVASGGRVLSLMGPSGAGKTTLLNALAGRASYAKVRGKVTYNGRPLSRDDLDFVPQFDDLNEYFTVRELLTYTARLKRKVEDTRKSIDERVDRLLAILGLEEQQNKTATQLTGGQRKRVSIGVGLVAEPRILFLDEPTTGLDSSAAFGITNYIVKVARATGVVCIMTIHQPSGAVFARLDDLYLLEQGRLAFAGSLDKAEVYFKDIGFERDPSENPADYYLDLVNISPASAVETVGHNGRVNIDGDSTWSGLYTSSSHVQDINKLVHAPLAEAGVMRVSESGRFFTLVEKLFLHGIRGPVYKLRVLQLLVLSLVLGTLYWRTQHGVDYLTEISGSNFMALWVTLFAVVAAAPAFCIDRRQVQISYLNGEHQLLSYSVAQFLTSLPFQFISALIFQAIFHWMAGFNDWFPSFVYSVIMSLLLLLGMEGIVLSVVEGLKNPMLSTTFSMIVLGTLFLMPGFFVPVDDMPPAIGWMPYLIFTTWATRGSLSNALNGQPFTIPSGGSVDGGVLYESVFKFDLNQKWTDLGIVVAWVFAFRIMHYGILVFSNRHFAKGKKAAGSNDDDNAATSEYTSDGRRRSSILMSAV